MKEQFSTMGRSYRNQMSAYRFRSEDENEEYTQGKFNEALKRFLSLN